MKWSPLRILDEQRKFFEGNGYPRETALFDEPLRVGVNYFVLPPDFLPELPYFVHVMLADSPLALLRATEPDEAILIGVSEAVPKTFRKCVVYGVLYRLILPWDHDCPETEAARAEIQHAEGQGWTPPDRKAYLAMRLQFLDAAIATPAAHDNMDLQYAARAFRDAFAGK